MRTKQFHPLGQNGFVSIVISLTVIIVLALITVAFSTLSRREQQSALDAQLSNQATYAAESGINDAIKKIDDGTLPVGGYPTCQQSMLDPTNDVSYSCLLVEMNPPSLYYSNVSSQTGKTVDFGVTGGGSNVIRSLTINWGSADNHSNFAGVLPTGASADKAFKTLATWGATTTGMLQFNITPYLSAAATRDNLIRNSFTTYLYPASSGTSTISYPGSPANISAAQASLIGGSCNAGITTRPQPCEATITFPAAVAGQRFAVHFTDFYDASNVTIRATSTTGNPMTFIDGQALIDSTGRARDTLRRLQVRVPLNNSITNYINAGLEAQSVCKQLNTRPGATLNLCP